MKFEITDEAVLCLAGATSAVIALPMLVKPSMAHDTFYVLQDGKNATKEHVTTCRWGGHSLACLAATTLSVGMAEGSRPAKKNMLKAGAAAWLAGAGWHLYNGHTGVQQKGVSVGMAGFSTAMAGLCLYRGLAKDD